ncbi:MAG: BatA domain-containing protein [Pyrinomonadaceae bacterium]|nr:BatA domain-containing protein [Phycisphaerales bacterium]
MTFLTPIPAIIAAAITVPILLLYYFLKLRRQAVRVSSTLLWERAIKDLQVNTPFRWLRFSVLLLLQLITLAAFLLALARPAIDDPLAAGSRVIILIDRSASMAAKDGLAAGANAGNSAGPGPAVGGATPAITRLDQARTVAIDLIAQLTHTRGWLSFFGSQQNSAQICIAEFSSRADVRTAFTSDVATLREAVEGVGQTDQPGDLSAAMQLVQGIAAAQFDENEEARSITLFVVSDGSFEPDIERPSPGINDVRFVQVGPKVESTSASADGTGEGATGVQSPASTGMSGRGQGSAPPDGTSPPSRDNLGITAISARRDTETPSIIRLFVRVQNASSTPVSTTLRLTLNGQPISTRQVTVPGAGPRSLNDEERGVASGTDASGESTAATGPPTSVDSPTAALPSPSSRSIVIPEAAITFELESAEGGLGEVSLGGSDLLPSDDSVAIMLRPASKAKVLVVAPDGTPDRFLLNVLEVMDLPILISADPVYYEQIAANAAADTARANREGAGSLPVLSDWDLVIFDGYRPERLPGIPSISVGAGLPIPGLSVTAVAAGEAAQGEGQSGEVTGFDGAGTVARFVTWRRTHAIMQSVNLDGIVIAPPMNILLPTTSSMNTTVLAWGRGDGVAAGSSTSGDGPLIVLLETVGGGGGAGSAPKRLVVGFDLLQSNWPVEDSFPPFVMNAVEFLSAKGGGLVGRSFTTADPIAVQAARGEREITVQGPERLTAPVPISRTQSGPAPDAAAGGEASGIETPIGTLALAGVYQVKGVVPESPDVFLAVNVCDGWESRLGVSGSIDIPGSGSRKSTGENDARRELWQWFIAAALVLLTIEWFVFARRIRV